MMTGADLCRLAPVLTNVYLLPSAFRRRLRLLHLLCHFGFDSLEVEARALLHRRILKEGLERLAHYLLDKHETPELVLEPIEILLCAFFGAVVGPASPLERIQPQVSNVGDVELRLFAEPAVGLVDESEFVVVNADSAYRAFAEVENFMTRRRTFARDRSQLVVAIKMVLVRSSADLLTFQQFVRDVRISGGGDKSGQPIQTGEDSVLNCVRRHFTGPTDQCWYPEAALKNR